MSEKEESSVWRVVFPCDHWVDPDGSEAGEVEVRGDEELKAEVEAYYRDWHINEYCEPHEVEWLAWRRSSPSTKIADRVESKDILYKGPQLNTAIYDTAEESGSFFWGGDEAENA